MTNVAKICQCGKFNFVNTEICTACQASLSQAKYITSEDIQFCQTNQPTAPTSTRPENAKKKGGLCRTCYEKRIPKQETKFTSYLIKSVSQVAANFWLTHKVF